MNSSARCLDLNSYCAQLNIAAYDYLCQEIRYELAEAYREMLDIKTQQVRPADVDVHAHISAFVCILVINTSSYSCEPLQVCRNMPWHKLA
jgi:hypothetical protein